MLTEEIVRNISLRLGIERLNAMQQAVISHCVGNEGSDAIVYAPTGSGKTLAVAVPVLAAVTPGDELQAVVLAPTRELALQLHNVYRVVATGMKVTALYGGHSAREEQQSLLPCPDIVIATPGRLLDHLKRESICLDSVKWLVIDEFDKMLELGFDDEMRRLIAAMPQVRRRWLTSATRLVEPPAFLSLNKAAILDFLPKNNDNKRINYQRLNADNNGKLAVLRQLLLTADIDKCIVFVNQRTSVEPVARYLNKHGITCGVFHGALDQADRERAVALFNNGSCPVIVSTDLAARGLDIADVSHIVHLDLPTTQEVWTHRNGRTARVDNEGTVVAIFSPDEKPEAYMAFNKTLSVFDKTPRQHLRTSVSTLYFNAGRKEKISRADIVGFIVANSNIEAREIGAIDLKDHYVLAAIPADKATEAVTTLQPKKIKGKRVRISIYKPTIHGDSGI